ncbi:flagellar filament capping protein FliD [Marinobacter daepoensis]|uniref:Flagellar hook-associated protein 2 n=1 Tax=Marinobacter daepoensis TaxID=262077 RepID=A0ABS3BHM6_9GAMM|nr:flagellar filament capping protein FliD [Marinobacter daepoensis]MBN7771309.1 flagellar filament capping protein FliD [Marinobacter daepoensis]MBY6079171.1 flagellar filament capping protein FliD [Marinobacter daepoensis]
MASISSIGAGSGLFTNDLLNQLVQVERAPTEARLNRREAETQAKISAFGMIRSALEALKTPMEALSQPDSMRSYTSSSSNESVVGVSVDSSTANRGSYTVDVQQLAQAQSLASAAFADRDTTALGSGTLSLTVGGVTTDIEIDGSNNTLQGVADAINDANAGVSAGVVDTGDGYRLVLSSDSSGTANEMSISVSDDDGNNTDSGGLSQFVFDGTTSNMEQTVAAKDAILDINGIQVTRSTNTIENVVDGVTFDVLATGVSTVKVTQDEEAVVQKVQDFVDKFNALQDQIKKVAGYNAETETGGLLNGDSTIRAIQSDLRQQLTKIPAGLEDSPIRMLADIGITTDPASGKLEFDQSVFKEKLGENPEAMTALFAESEQGGGIAAQMVASAERFLGSDGLLANRTEGLGEALQEIEDQRFELDDRIAAFEKRLIQQFSAADQLIAQIQSTGNFVQQQLAALAPQPRSNG